MVRPPDSFQVELEVFQGPFDLLLQLITRRQLDITEVALSDVTDEFIEHMKRVQDLSEATEFLVVAATLLEMKASELLPQLDSEPQLSFEELSARDLLFSRLLQYKAFKEAAGALESKLKGRAGIFARNVPLEPHFAALLPELIWSITPGELASAAAAALSEKPAPDEAEHIARPLASLEDEVHYVKSVLSEKREITFSFLARSSSNRAVLVTRFLAILELFRSGLVSLRQEEVLGTLWITATGVEEKEGNDGR